MIIIIIETCYRHVMLYTNSIDLHNRKAYQRLHMTAVMTKDNTAPQTNIPIVIPATAPMSDTYNDLVIIIRFRIY